MISVEEKLRVFTQYLLNKERKWGKDIINDAKEKREALLEESSQKINKEKRAVEERSYHTIFRDKNKIIAEGKNKAKTLELEEKNRILRDFNQMIREKVEPFLTQEVYSDYLRNCIVQIPQIFGNKKEIIVFVYERDLEQIKKIMAAELNDFSIEYRVGCNDCIGGLIVEDSEGRIHCDFTVENLIKTNYKLIGMTLNGFMEKQVS
ncbi:V-type ATP synthase subunit E [Acetobacterium woodii]|uniref:V-ATPase E-subunit VatE n=1 Tax=Acetobacterium woodii (strain ATCC 29683 / DSM 1030 / JCM 2381 / KCTC 1655 / WB1) TaxID=931626 RepID=H6LDC0_ACEWD|nr:V-type ATP synthase subunit E [Acetobacterium woodii]AFA49165.1 V-ATPase E-subunit VatE [Acetobacterium woodii DSM 1030]